MHMVDSAGLDYGEIASYDIERGFGFVGSTLQFSQAVPARSPSRSYRKSSEVWFHVKVLKRGAPDLAAKLDAGTDGGVVFWFVAERSDKGMEVKQVWADLEKVPTELCAGAVARVRDRWQEDGKMAPLLPAMTRHLLGEDELARLSAEREAAIAAMAEAERLRQVVEAEEARQKEKEARAERIRQWPSFSADKKAVEYFALDPVAQAEFARDLSAALCELPLRAEVQTLVADLRQLPVELRSIVARKTVYAKPIPLAGWALSEILPTLSLEKQVQGVRRVMEGRSPRGQSWLHQFIPARLAVRPEIRVFGDNETLLAKAREVLATTACSDAISTALIVLKSHRSPSHRDKEEAASSVLVRRAYELDKGISSAGEFKFDQACALTICALQQQEALADGHPVRGSTHPVTQLVLEMADAWIGSQDTSGIDFATRVETYIADMADCTEEPISLGMLLSPCLVFSPVLHCEARRAPSLKANQGKPPESEQLAWCPRLGKPAALRGRGDSIATVKEVPKTKYRPAYLEAYCGCAHVNALANKFTLVELLQATGQPAPDGIREGDQYATWLSGLINRLNDIRQRLRCSCGARHLMDRGYALHLARYRGTVGRCPVGHEEVYFNHCWNCGGVIDSRESAVSVNKRAVGPPYVCINCGAGPKNDRDFIGSVCPVFGCGTAMEPVEGSPRFKCPNGHSIDSTRHRGIRLGESHMIPGTRSCCGSDPSYVPLSDLTKISVGANLEEYDPFADE